ncbi:hypothetical protein BS78_05G041900 [Paspalum vaginatum]|nr:hypothetical protein BS78_05G041900 [Paspalum vaginatum]
MALVATIGGNRPPVSVEQVRQYLVSFHGVAIDRFSVHLYSPEDFLVVFSDLACRDRDLHGAPPQSPLFRLIWRPWLRLSMATPDKMRFKVLLVLRGIPAHAWSLDSAQRVLGSSCAGLEAARETIDKVDLKHFVVAAWCAHPHLIPSVKRLWVPEPKKPHEPGNLFLREHEVMHTVFPGMTPLREVSPDCRDSDDDEDYPGFHEFDEDDSWQPWPRRSRFVVDASLPALGPGWGRGFRSKASCRSWEPVDLCPGSFREAGLPFRHPVMLALRARWWRQIKTRTSPLLHGRLFLLAVLRRSWLLWRI